MTYGEAAFVVLFDLGIIYQILTYEKGGVGAGAVGGLLVYLVSFYLMMAGIVPYHILQVLRMRNAFDCHLPDTSDLV